MTAGRGWRLASPHPAVLAVPLVAGFAAAAAADVKLTSSVSTSATLTDNRDFEHDGESDVLLSVTPSISLRQTGGRSSSTLDYSLSGQFGARDSSFDIIHTLSGANNTELVRDLLFIDSSAAIDQQVINAAQGAPARTGDTGNNLALVQRYTVSPYLLQQFGSFAESETRVRAGYVTSTSSSLDSQTEYEALQTLSSGRQFTSFFWDLTARYLVSNVGDDDERKTQTYRLDTSTAIDRHFSLLAGIGYEKIEDNSLDQQPDGIIWDAGFSWRPGPKLSLQATYGERFDEQNINASLDYKFSNRTTLSASYSQTLTTQQELLLSDLSFIGFDDEGNLVDTRTGLPITSTESLFGLSNQTFRRDVLTARFSTTRERNTYTADASYEVRESGTGDSSTTVKSVSAGWTHALTRSMSMDLTASYDNIDFGGSGTDAGRQDDLYTFQASLSEQLAKTVTASANYTFRHLDSSAAGTDATENAIVFTLTKTF